MPAQKSYQIQHLDHLPSQLLEEMLSFVANSLKLQDDRHKILPRSKYILTELITNALKHSSSGLSNINIKITDKEVIISKSDYGDQIIWPQVKNDLGKNAYTIAVDIMHTLYAIKESNHINFYFYEHDEPIITNNDDYPEHFGLLIITKSSDGFYYTFDSVNGINIFSATMKIG